MNFIWIRFIDSAKAHTSGCLERKVERKKLAHKHTFVQCTHTHIESLEVYYIDSEPLFWLCFVMWTEHFYTGSLMFISVYIYFFFCVHPISVHLHSIHLTITRLSSRWLYRSKLLVAPLYVFSHLYTLYKIDLRIKWTQLNEFICM